MATQHLGKRLTAISQMVAGEYTHIWDCCCDHGSLGASLLAKNLATTVHFVDVVDEIVTPLRRQLMDFFPPLTQASAPAWETHCMDVSQIPLNKYSGTHLLIIAGVGGDLTGDLVTALVGQYPHTDIDLIVCPVHHQHALRTRLITLGLCTIDECLIEENKRFYEVLYLSTRHGTYPPVTQAGDKIWAQNDLSHRYLNKVLAHYRRAAQSDNRQAKKALSDYQEVAKRIQDANRPLNPN